MYAILRQGGRQYRVSPGDVIQIESIEAEKGDEIVLEDVLMIGQGEGVEVGSPCVEGAAVKARVLRNGRGRKVIAFKKKKRKGFTKTIGHRQNFTELMIKAISKGGQDL